MHAVHYFDLLLFHFVNSFAGSWTVDRIVAYEERSQLLKGGLMLACYWWFWFAGPESRRQANRQRIIEALIGVFVALVLARILAATLPFRMRPMYAAGIGYHAPSISLAMDLEHWSSFPSDTAALFFALSFGLFRLSRPLGVGVMLWSAIWICLPRLYLGIHYPSDLIAGALLGVATVWAVAWIMRAHGAAFGRRLMAWIATAERRWPQVLYAAAFALSFEIAMIFDDVRDLVRGVLHAMRSDGYAGLGEGAALFITGGLVLLLIAIGLMVVLTMQRRRSEPERPGLGKTSSGPMPQG